MHYLTLPDGLDIIDDNAFRYNNIYTLIVPSSVRFINLQAFSW
ncbi:hypothetical protein H6769_04750 [Candidatus Peribacteria bacterium]|nr:hypothetical protein [Candidatus Peribacteria bacterium]